MDLTDKYLTRKEVCDTLGISTSTLRRLVDLGDFPQPIQVSERRQLFSQDRVFDWLLERDVDRIQQEHEEDWEEDDWDDDEEDDDEE